MYWYLLGVVTNTSLGFSTESHDLLTDLFHSILYSHTLETYFNY